MEATIIILQSKEAEEIDDRAVPTITNEMPPTTASPEAIKEAIAALTLAYPDFNIFTQIHQTTTTEELI